MLTVLVKNGWRFFFFSNEGNEPMHIHITKAEKSCKFFLNEIELEVSLVYRKNMRDRDVRDVKEIILENFNYIAESWKKFYNKK
jgi:hypothetical protein